MACTFFVLYFCVPCTYHTYRRKRLSDTFLWKSNNCRLRGCYIPWKFIYDLHILYFIYLCTHHAYRSKRLSESWLTFVGMDAFIGIRYSRKPLRYSLELRHSRLCHWDRGKSVLFSANRSFFINAANRHKVASRARRYICRPISVFA